MAQQSVVPYADEVMNKDFPWRESKNLLLAQTLQWHSMFNAFL